MALDINQLKAAFAKKSETNGDGGNTGFWDKFYAFYRMEFNESATFRFLPDADINNPLGFIIENKYHELMVNGKKKRIACLKMYGEDCPCCHKSGEYYNAGDTTMGKAFWRKIDYVAQGLVIHSPFEYPIKADENPVRLVSMSKQLYEKIENEIVKGDLDDMPYDMEKGYDFRILKNKKIVPGGKEFASYSDSGFARKSSPIPDDLAARVELLDLKSFRYVKVEREQMEANIEAFLTGRALEGDKSTQQAPAYESADKPTQDADTMVKSITESVAPAAAPAASTSDAPKLSPQDILKKIRERQAAQSS